MLRAMLAMHQLEGTQQWDDRMNRLVHTLKQIAIRNADSSTSKAYAYYRTTPGYGDIFSYPKSAEKQRNCKRQALATIGTTSMVTFAIT